MLLLVFSLRIFLYLLTYSKLRTHIFSLVAAEIIKATIINRGFYKMSSSEIQRERSDDHSLSRCLMVFTIG
jgi:hypothetical protein